MIFELFFRFKRYSRRKIISIPRRESEEGLVKRAFDLWGRNHGIRIFVHLSSIFIIICNAIVRNFVGRTAKPLSRIAPASHRSNIISIITRLSRNSGLYVRSYRRLKGRELSRDLIFLFSPFPLPFSSPLFAIYLKKFVYSSSP